MRNAINPNSLEVLKQSLRDLEALKLIGPSDLDILDMRRDLKQRIAALEAQQEQSRSYEMAANAEPSFSS